MPFMTDGRGVELIGGWFGTGPERGIALIFTIAGVVGIVVTARTMELAFVPATRGYELTAASSGRVGWSVG